jgi:hypothetical protein
MDFERFEKRQQAAAPKAPCGRKKYAALAVSAAERLNYIGRN